MIVGSKSNIHSICEPAHSHYSFPVVDVDQGRAKGRTTGGNKVKRLRLDPFARSRTRSTSTYLLRSTATLLTPFSTAQFKSAIGSSEAPFFRAGRRLISLSYLVP